ncbi:MAG: hypothetical protein KKH04_10435 [Proteobacteria bacterium]|nr:hypothetical protein [Pseudomonadota bacterium]
MGHARGGAQSQLALPRVCRGPSNGKEKLVHMDKHCCEVLNVHSRRCGEVEKENKVSDFGGLLIGSAWLPGPDGKFSKASDLPLDDLPELFTRDKNLADQLGMRKNVIGKLVEALSRDHFTKEHEAQFLALCPLCAAMFKEFVK